MSVGSKIKALRKRRGMTQAILADGIITRGMLSQIENGCAMPSMQSLNALALKLEVSPSFLIEDGDDILPAEEARISKAIEKEYRAGNYHGCLDLFEYLHLETDAKFAPIFVSCAFETAKSYFFKGEFALSKELLKQAEAILPNLIIPPAGISQKQITLLFTIIENIDNIDKAVELADYKPDFSSSISVFFTLLKLLKSGNLSDCVSLLKHCEMEKIHEEYINALLIIKDYKFIDAIISLKAILAKEECPIFMKLLCLASIENCCKLCEDYKGAYENHLAHQNLLNSIKR